MVSLRLKELWCFFAEKTQVGQNKEIKKFGKTWVITEEAVRKHFGDNIDIYFNNIRLLEIQGLKGDELQSKLEEGLCKSKRRSKKKDTLDLSSSSESLGRVDNLEYEEVDPRSVISSFNFDNQIFKTKN